MAIKIDLLPGYVKLKRDLNRSIAACVVVFCVVASGLWVQLKKSQNELATVTQNMIVMQGVATAAKTASDAADASVAAAAPAVGAINFMTSATKTGTQRAALIDLVTKYIDQNAVVSDIDISDGKTVIISATVRTPDEYQRFVLDLRSGSDKAGGVLFKDYPTAKGPQGFAAGAAPFVLPTAPTSDPVPITYPIAVTATGVLLHPITVPADPTAGSAATTPGAPGAPGALPVAP